MSKPTIFLSHISEERALAVLFKEQIEKTFLGLVDVFVSSDAQSIPLGQNWLDSVTRGLRSCKAMLLLCSPASIKRPWINFEAGAGWARNIEVAPICHSGLRPVDLPLPMSLLQGLEAHDPTKIEQIFQLIAKQLGSSLPDVDASALAAKVKVFEAPYIVRLRLAEAALTLKSTSPNVVSHILTNPPGVTIAMNGISERDYVLIRPSLEALQSARGLQHSFSVTSLSIGGGSGGAYGNLNVAVSSDLHALLTDL